MVTRSAPLALSRPACGLVSVLRGQAQRHVLSFSLFTPNSGVDSTEADRLVAMESASARTLVMRFVRACGIAAPPWVRNSCIPQRSYNWFCLLQASAATAQPVTASSHIRPTPAPSARLPRQANPPRTPVPARVPQPLRAFDQRSPRPAFPHHHPPPLPIAHPAPLLPA